VDVNIGFGGSPLLDKVSMQVEKGKRVCLLGRKGISRPYL
jgi:ABC transport system ATP-binding/permease protein